MPGRPFLSIPGPTNIPERVRRAMQVLLEDHRAPDYPGFLKPLLEDLKKVFRTATGQVFVYPCSGTGGWEAAIVNTLSPGDKVLQSVFGQFSLLWADLCRRQGMDVVQIDCEWGEGVPLDKYREVLGADGAHAIKAVLVTHNETATGVTSSIKAVRDILDELNHPALLMIDGVSSLASIDFRMDEWGVDIAISGSQKGFMLPTGLAIVCVSQKALEAHKHSRHYKCFFDFADMQRMNKDGWFPYTPAQTLMRGLRESLDMLFEEGLDNVFARHFRLAEGVRRAVATWGLKLCAKDPKWYSDTVSAIVVPDGIDSAAVVKTAYERYQLSLGLGLNKVAGKVFRIGHIADNNELMVLASLAGAEMAMLDCGIRIQPGSGVAAASDYYRATGAWNAQATALRKTA
jgi:alanine-glyoxylate transaminase/serine-glyoxylate transaminase/serine-pyruvate transaminase